MTLRAFCMKYFRVLNSRAASTTGWPLRRTSCDDKSTTTSPKTITLSVLVVLKRFTAWPNRPSSLVDSKVSVQDLLSDISRTASFFIVDLSIRTRTGRKRERLRISFELMVGMRARDDASMKTADVACGRERCAICASGFFTTAPIEFPPVGVNYRVCDLTNLDPEIGNQENCDFASFH